MTEQFWWYVVRASGMVAAVLIALTLIWGLLLSTRIIERRGLPAWLTDLHRGLGGLAAVFTGVHLFALWADSYEHFGLADLFVPFASAWKTGPVAWGVIALWMIVVVEVTSLAMRRMSRKVWRGLHYLSYPAGLLVGVHAVTAGTDRNNPAFIATTVALGAALMFLIVYRILSRKGLDDDPRVARRAGRAEALAAARSAGAGAPSAPTDPITDTAAVPPPYRGPWPAEGPASGPEVGVR